MLKTQNRNRQIERERERDLGGEVAKDVSLITTPECKDALFMEDSFEAIRNACVRRAVKKASLQ